MLWVVVWRAAPLASIGETVRLLIVVAPGRRSRDDHGVVAAPATEKFQPVGLIGGANQPTRIRKSIIVASNIIAPPRDESVLLFGNGVVMRRVDAFMSTMVIVGAVALFFAVCMLARAFVSENLDHTPNPEARAIYEKRPGNHFEPVEPSTGTVTAASNRALNSVSKR